MILEEPDTVHPVHPIAMLQPFKRPVVSPSLNDPSDAAFHVQVSNLSGNTRKILNGASPFRLRQHPCERHSRSLELVRLPSEPIDGRGDPEYGRDKAKRTKYSRVDRPVEVGSSRDSKHDGKKRDPGLQSPVVVG